MIKALSAIVIATFISAALAVLPGFAPQVEASVPQALAKADRLDVRVIGKDCSQHACCCVGGTLWPPGADLNAFLAQERSQPSRLAVQAGLVNDCAARNHVTSPAPRGYTTRGRD